MKNKIKSRQFWKFGFLTAAVFFILLSFLITNIYDTDTSVRREVKKAERYLKKRQADFENILSDSALVNRLLNNTADKDDFISTVNRDYDIFLYKRTGKDSLALQFWSKQEVLPPLNALKASQPDEAFLKLNTGYYYFIKRNLDNLHGGNIAAALVQVRSEFFLETNYLPLKFTFSETADRRIELSEQPTSFAVKSPGGKVLFYIKKKEKTNISYHSPLIKWFRFGGLLLLLLFLHLQAEQYAKKRILKGVIFLAVSLLATRLLIYAFPGLLNLRQFQLFGPEVYESGPVNKSLGDLLLNSVFLCWIILFIWNKVAHIKSFNWQLTELLRRILGFFAVALLIYSTFLLSSSIKSIVADSKISFDVTNLSSLSQYTFIGFIILAVQTLTYYYFTQLLYRVIFSLFIEKSYLVYFAIAIAGLIFLSINSTSASVLFYLPVLAWLLLYTWLVQREGIIFYGLRINIAGILFWIFVFSVSIAAIMITESGKKELDRRKFFVERLAFSSDPTSEALMAIALTYLDRDFLTDNFSRFADGNNGKLLRDSIIENNYSGYLNKYNTRLYVYDSAGRGLYNDDDARFEALRNIVRVQSLPTSKQDLYYYETTFDQFAYITYKTILTPGGDLQGSMFIISNPKRYTGEAMFPELFKQSGRSDIENSPIYSYAIYNQRQLVDVSGKYPYPTTISPSGKNVKEFERKQNASYDELWYYGPNQKVVVMTREKNKLIESITLFSWIFCSFLFLVFCVQLLSLLVKAATDWKSFTAFFHFSIRNQVHSTIIFISLFSFLIIGIATINFFRSRYNKNNVEKLSRTMSIMLNQLKKEFSGDKTAEQVFSTAKKDSSHRLQQLINEVSDIHGVDVNLYDLNGNLQVSSETELYDRGVLSNVMNPVAFFHLNRLKQVEQVQEESIGKLSYLNIYAPIRSEGKEYGYLSIPYYTSQPELNQEISNFIVTVINLNAFILLVAGLIALFITNRITRSFAVISERMKEVNLGKLNEEILWTRDDEIGDLVTEYNKMVNKLEESAAALAKTEREGAWREMARQVAHEIKNPLTPMKLSLQYLQRALDTNQGNVKELSNNVAKTLVEQIDHLSKIASDFSQFANIGNVKNEVFDLHDVLDSLYKLYRTSENSEFKWYSLDQPLMLFTDKTQINRLFTNLFINALEACQESKKCIIEVRERIKDGFVQIEVKDNGDGISAETQERIFIPNFTTKSSGTGLGLAMSKGIVEQARGKIWFETIQGKGTSFFVELPLHV